jgi:hypothetical protein
VISSASQKNSTEQLGEVYKAAAKIKDMIRKEISSLLKGVIPSSLT